MPTLNSIQFSLTTVDNKEVTVRIKYNAVFNKFERFLASNGLKFTEYIDVLGIDFSMSGPAEKLLFSFPASILPVTAGTTTQTVPRDVTDTRPRSAFQEDPGRGDDDEIRCRISIRPSGMPVIVSELTGQKTLAG